MLTPCYSAAVSPESRPPARVITSLNLKGGVGKTHLCWLIAGVCEKRGRKCLVVDLDKQANVTTTLLGNDVPGSGSEALFNPAIDASIGSLVRRTSLSHVDCIPASFALERFNVTDPTKWSETGMERALVDPLREIGSLYDYVLLDCPADISLITYAALCASDFLLVPLEAAEWGSLGIQHVTATMQHVRDNRNPKLRLLGYVVSRFKRARKYQSTHLKTFRDHFGFDAFKTVIPDAAPFEQSVTDRIPIVLHSPSSHASIVAERFFDELEARAEVLHGLRPDGRRDRIRQPVQPRTR